MSGTWGDQPRRSVIVAAPATTRRRARAQSKATRKLAKSLLDQDKLAAPGADPDLEDLAPLRRWGRMAKGAMWGPISPKTPLHETSTARVGVLSPFLASTTGNIGGPAIGIDARSGAVFRFDPWQAYGAGLVTSPGMAFFGQMGSGKSTCAKTLALRLIHYGRHVIVQNDPKGEWAPIAQALDGGQVLKVGPGTGTVINPLDGGHPPAGMSQSALSAWHQEVASRRATMLRAVASVLRHGQAFTEREEAALDWVLQRIGTGELEPTIRAVYVALEDAPADLVASVGPEAPRTLSLVFGRLVHGSLAGMFDTASTVTLDPGAPMTVVDTSVLLNAAGEIKALASACIAAWVDATLRSMDGRFRIVISEEGWAELRDPYLVQAMDERLRMAGHWRASNWLIFHELEDLSMFGEEGSAQRAQVRGLISKSPIKVIYSQSSEALPNAIDMLKLNREEASVITTLPQGVGLWRIGEDAPVLVHPVLTPRAYALFNTDAGRQG